MPNKTTAAPENRRPWSWYRVGALEEHLSGSVLLRSRVGDSQEGPSPTYPTCCIEGLARGVSLVFRAWPAAAIGEGAANGLRGTTD